jgi:uncharacterized repeat protein (TIGR03843 family)
MPAETDVERLLAHGELEILGVLPRSSNFTFLVRARDAAGTETLAVYKPRAGEAPLWDFPDGTLGKREVAAYLVARALGWPWVPTTDYRDGPEGPGSVQLFVEFDPSQHYFTLVSGREDEFRAVALFDAVVNNADRKGGHCLLSVDGRVFAIDHGVCFGTGVRLRTVIWDFAGEPIAEAALADLVRVRTAVASGELGVRLRELLAGEEVSATVARIDHLVSARRFPTAELERPYPWPAI